MGYEEYISKIFWIKYYQKKLIEIPSLSKFGNKEALDYVMLASSYQVDINFEKIFFFIFPLEYVRDWKLRDMDFIAFVEIDKSHIVPTFSFFPLELYYDSWFSNLIFDFI